MSLPPASPSSSGSGAQSYQGLDGDGEARGGGKLAGPRESQQLAHGPRHKACYISYPWKPGESNPRREAQQRVEFVFKKTEGKRG